MHKSESIARITALTLLLAAAGNVSAQQAGSGSQYQESRAIGIFAGATNTDPGDAEGTLGLEYIHPMQGAWSVGGIVEHTPDAYFASDITTALGMVHYRPANAPRFRLSGGGGVEFNDFGDDVIFRLGIGYDLVQGPVRLTPRISVDMGNGRENYVLGATAYFSF